VQTAALNTYRESLDEMSKQHQTLKGLMALTAAPKICF
jgi:hypothetical protein